MRITEHYRKSSKLIPQIQKKIDFGEFIGYNKNR